MSNLIKPYEIAVYDDVLQDGVFVEKRLGIIGSNEMTGLNRAIEPNLVRNVNGTKKFSFKMYKHFIDTTTGEKVDNPFIDWLVSERKIKLFYDEKWYDFIIKNIVENSSNYLYTYQLEDALVQELSKNGFNVTLDAESMNNMDTAQGLATRVLEDTDWTVESEALVEKVEENLVYVKIPAWKTVYPIVDQKKDSLQIGVIPQDGIQVDDAGWEALAFYSSCTNKPHRFQFIYIPNGYSNKDGKTVSTDENRVINVEDCQYYYEVDEPENEYKQNETYKQFYLPEDFSIIHKTSSSIDDTADTIISTWYRGARYGFAQSAQYVPLLDRYCNKYVKDNIDYYGFVDNNYESPALLQNIITNTEFKSTTGWVGTYVGPTENIKDSVGATIEAVYGRFTDNNLFSSVIDELSDGSYSSDTVYTPYLKVTFPNRGSVDYGVLINSGFYDNRTTIGSVEYEEQWYFKPTIYNNSGEEIKNACNYFDFTLREATFNTVTGAYSLGGTWATISNPNDANYYVFKFNSSTTAPNIKMSEKEFKKKKVKLVITPKNEHFGKTYFIKDMQLFKLVLNDENEVIIPGALETDGVVTTTYKFFPASMVDSNSTITDAKEIEFDTIDSKEINYSIYKPVYNEDAQKVRSVTIKESNYFNILQSIAETFEAWLELNITRNPDTGAIEGKKAVFKNYIGKDNYAAFRYGVNFKDIQRTYESKNIVTKLMVKQNSNEHANNGFCTIARAGSNPTGESYIYDFRYFHDRGMLDSKEYIASLYYQTNPLMPEEEAISQEGPDVCEDEGHGTEGHECAEYNLQNYFNRIKDLNTKIIGVNDKLIPMTSELTKLKADLAVEEGKRDAAAEGLEEVREDFFALTGLTPETISEDDFTSITCNSDNTDEQDELNYGSWAKDPTVTARQIGAANSPNWQFNIELKDTLKTVDCELKVHPMGDFTPSWNGESLTSHGYSGLKVMYKYENNKRYKLSYEIETDAETVRIGGHNASFSNTLLRVKVGNGNWIETTSGSYVSFAPQSGTTILVESYGTYNKQKQWEAGDFGESGNNNEAILDIDCFFIQPNRGSAGETLGETICKIQKVVLGEYEQNVSDRERTLYIQPTFTLNKQAAEELPETTITRQPKIACTIPAYSNTATTNYSLAIVDTTASNISSLLTEYAMYMAEFNSAKENAGYDNKGTWKEGSLQKSVVEKETEIKNKQEEVNKLLEHKKALNKLFYTRYSRFIQEGTWIDEEYIDDDKYYNDALSVMYTSCYPQVAYSINVFSLSALPGYEMFNFDVGDKTYAIDPEFFGEKPEEVIINEMSNNLDDPSKDTIKVQNFKTQFQDLFQKITATVQQTQYREGAYEKAVALAEANASLKSEFLQDALNDASNKFSAAGQTSVVQDVNGITLTDENTKDQMRLIGGAILMSVQDEETGERKWKTGLTPEGISASLVTAGTINTGNISIMNGRDATFMWNAYGLSAFDVDWQNNIISGTPKKDKFVRFDKYGIYGISGNGTSSFDGTTWKPSSMDEVDANATFALTWEGLKVTGNKDGTTGKSGIVRIGKLAKTIKITEQEQEQEIEKDYLMIVQNKDGNDTLRVDSDGNVEVGGSLHIGSLDDGTTLDNYLETFDFTASSIAIYKQKGTTDNIIFSAKYNEDNEQGEVSLAGWTVTENSLYQGNFGDSDSFYIYPKGEEKTHTNFGANTWRLCVGAGFAVDRLGGIHAASGNIGKLKIDSEGCLKQGWYRGTEQGIIWLGSYFSTGPVLAIGEWKQTEGDSISNAPFTVNSDGYVKATKGEIGGWNLSQTSLYYQSDKGIPNTVYFQVTSGSGLNTIITKYKATVTYTELQFSVSNIRFTLTASWSKVNTGEVSQPSDYSSFTSFLSAFGFSASTQLSAKSASGTKKIFWLDLAKLTNLTQL